MTAQANADETSPESVPHSDTAAPTAEQVWEKVHNEGMKTVENPITKDDVRGGREPEPTAPERSLVAPKLAEVLKESKAPEPSPLEERLARIEEALAPKPAEETPAAIEDEVRELRQLILERDQRAEQQRLEAERQERLQLFREGVVSNIREQADRFPFLISLGMEDKVYETLVARLDAGETVSEDDIASEAEAKYAEAYERMQKAKQPTPQSEETSESDAPDTPTLTPTLTAADTPTDINSILEKTGGDRKQAAAELWENLMR